MEFLYSSHEATLKDETTKAFIPVSSVLTVLVKQTATVNIQNTSIELGESLLQQDEAQSSHHSITSDYLKIPPLRRF